MMFWHHNAIWIPKTWCFVQRSVFWQQNFEFDAKNVICCPAERVLKAKWWIWRQQRVFLPSGACFESKTENLTQKTWCFAQRSVFWEQNGEFDAKNVICCPAELAFRTKRTAFHYLQRFWIIHIVSLSRFDGEMPSISQLYFRIYIFGKGTNLYAQMCIYMPKWLVWQYVMSLE